MVEKKTLQSTEAEGFECPHGEFLRAFNVLLRRLVKLLRREGARGVSFELEADGFRLSARVSLEVRRKKRRERERDLLRELRKNMRRVLRSLVLGEKGHGGAKETQAERNGEGVRLTEKELSTVRLLRHGLRNRVIAARLGISEGTVRKRLRSAAEKLGVESQAELLRALVR